MASRQNALDQALDIAGSLTQLSTMTLADEPNFLGRALTGQTGSAASVSAFGAGIATIRGLTGMTAQSVGNFLTISGAASAGNNGTFLIVTYNSATSVDIANASGVSPDANDGTIVWTERLPYSLEDDLNFDRTDRAAIKGVAYSAAVPTQNFIEVVPAFRLSIKEGSKVPEALRAIDFPESAAPVVEVIGTGKAVFPPF